MQIYKSTRYGYGINKKEGASQFCFSLHHNIANKLTDILKILNHSMISRVLNFLNRKKYKKVNVRFCIKKNDCKIALNDPIYRMPSKKSNSKCQYFNRNQKIKFLMKSISLSLH